MLHRWTDKRRTVTPRSSETMTLYVPLLNADVHDVRALQDHVLFRHHDTPGGVCDLNRRSCMESAHLQRHHACGRVREHGKRHGGFLDVVGFTLALALLVDGVVDRGFVAVVTSLPNDHGQEPSSSVANSS